MRIAYKPYRVPVSTMSAENSSEPSSSSTLFRIVLPILILGLALGGGYWLMNKPPAADKDDGPPPRTSRIVDVITVPPTVESLVVEAMGTVMPSKQIELRPRVGGYVISIHPQLIPGGVIAENDTMLTLDPTDFELTVKQREADLASTQSALELEKAQQATAREELALIGERVSDEDKRYVLREPQLANIEAQIKSAEARLAEATTALERANIRAPFNAVVMDRSVDVGSQIGQNSPLATLAGSDTFWIEFQVPTDELQWIHFPDANHPKGSEVVIHDETAWHNSVNRTGHVIGLASDLEQGARTAKVLVEVADPLALKEENAASPKLLLNSYVHGEIQGINIEESVEIPRDYLRRNDTAWVMNDEGKLEIRKVAVIYTGRDAVIITDGIKVGEKLITTRLRAAVDGMDVRVEEPTEEEPAE